MKPAEPAFDFDEEFERAVAAWRERHRLREDDAVLLLVELFRIHQQHWDALRRRDSPSWEQLRRDLVRFDEVVRRTQDVCASLNDRLPRLVGHLDTPRVTRTAAWLAAVAGSLAGYLIGKAGL
ncbi:MAG: hypothetical protein KF791_09715 [Verrucomicrobiae bacterium]|nr:hypothetical protein [Verrucomicrobiae bacterium]